jgi:hypothetical protein
MKHQTKNQIGIEKGLENLRSKITVYKLFYKYYNMVKETIYNNSKEGFT